VLGTDIGLNFGELYLRNNKNLRIDEDKPVMMNGMYRKIVISKVALIHNQCLPKTECYADRSGEDGIVL
jgi:hypothetical protein